MKAAIVRSKGQPPVYADIAEPHPAQGEVLVDIRAAAISPLVRARASGAHYSATQHFPFAIGVDGTGTLPDGTSVYFILPEPPNGSFAERTAVPSARCLPLPEGLDPATAAAIANPGMSSWAALTQRAHIQSGETVLINGATGMSGRLAVRIARHLGAKRIIATGRNADILATLGADRTISLTDSPEHQEKALGEEFARGLDIVLDYLWGESARRILFAAAKTAEDGVPVRFVQIGSAGGAEIGLPGALFRSKAIALMGSGIGSVTLDGLLQSIAGLFAAAGPAGLTLPTRLFPLDEIERIWGEAETASRLVCRIG
jgi:NADPH2:quinone reductase